MTTKVDEKPETSTVVAQARRVAGRPAGAEAEVPKMSADAPSGVKVLSAKVSADKPADKASKKVSADKPADKASKKVSADKPADKASKKVSAEKVSAEKVSAEKVSAEKTTPFRTGLRLARVGAAVLLVASLALALLQWRSVSGRADALGRENSDRAVLLGQAKQYAIDFASYSYKTLDADYARVKSHLTGSFVADYEKAAEALKPVVQKYQGGATATVEGAGIESYDGTHATVVVFLDQTIVNSTSKTPRVDRNRLSLTLERVGGTWLVSGLLQK